MKCLSNFDDFRSESRISEIKFFAFIGDILYIEIENINKKAGEILEKLNYHYL